MKPLKVLVWLLVSGLLLGRPAQAATTFSVVASRPSPQETDFHFIYGTQNLFRLEWQAGTQADYAFRSLDGSTRRIIDQLVTEHFFGAIGLTDWFSVGLDMPIVWVNHFQDPTPVTAPGFTNSIDLGDPRVEMKLQILSRYRSPVGLALVPFVHIPTGNEARFVGDETVVGGGILAVDTEFLKRLLISLNAGAEVKESVNLSNVNLSPANLLLGLGTAFKVTRNFDVTAEGHAKTPLGNFFKEEAETPIEALGGVRLTTHQGIVISAGGGGGIVHGVGAPRYRAFLGLGYLGRRSDHDQKVADLQALKYKPQEPAAVEWSIVELKPKCPADPAQFDPTQHDAGCPKYYELSQIASLTLRCPSRPEDFDPTVHDQGCQKVYDFRKGSSAEEYATVYVLAASELSGKCPSDPAQFDPAKHDPGCPKFFELKETVSLVANCPANPKEFNPEIHDPACSKVYQLKQQYASRDLQAIRVLSQSDSDQDGILDFEDRCPHEIGTAAGFGCPETEIQFKKGQLLGTTIPITFGFNHWVLTPAMAKALNEVATVLMNHPEIKRVRIEGHADSLGSTEANLTVSRRRAETIKKFLQSCGVAPDRLKAVGLGAKQPIAKNKTAAGRAKNRRATVLVLELVE